MFSIRNHLILYVLLLSAILTSCIKEDRDDCLYVLRFKYDYNMDYVDMFSEKVDRLNVLVFDDQGLYVKELTAVANPEFGANYMMPVELTSNQEYTFLTWGGLNKEQLELTELVPGQTNIDQVQIGLRNRENHQTSEQLSDLWYGKETVVVTDAGSTTIPLLKYTNKFRIALRLLPTEETSARDYEFDDISIWLESNNTLYNSSSESLNPSVFQYHPYFYEKDERGLLVELNTLRLIDKRINNMIFTNSQTNEVLLKIDLNKYLDDLKFLENAAMPFQEFLDRESAFAVILYLAGTDDLFSSFVIEINGWVIRTQDGEVID